MKRSLLLPLLCFLSVPCVQAQDWRDSPDGARGVPDQAMAEAHRAHTQRTAAALARAGKSRELALAAVLRGMVATEGNPGATVGSMPSSQVPADTEARTWLGRASALAADDVVANQILIAGANAHDPALRSAAAERWRDAEPDNLVPLLHLGLSEDALLVEARRTTRADAHMYEGLRWIAAVLRRQPPTAAEQAALTGGEPYHADEAAALQATALWTATLMPGYWPLTQACRGRALRATPTRTEDCRHVATLLAAPASNAADQGVGLGMLRELARDREERAAVDARRRTLDWRMLQWGRLSREQPRDGAAQFVRLLADSSVAGESQLVERVLQEAGVPLEPPADWSAPRY